MRDGDVTFLYADPRTGEYLRVSGEAKDVRVLGEAGMGRSATAALSLPALKDGFPAQSDDGSMLEDTSLDRVPHRSRSAPHQGAAMSRVMDGVILFAILAIFAGFAAHRLPFTASGTVPVRFPIALPIFLLLLVVLSVIDLHTFRLPDWGTKSGMFLGLLVSVLGCWVARVSLISPLQSVVGLLSGYGLLWAIAFGYRLITGREGLGMGDAKLLGMIGSWMGVAAVGNTLFLGSFLGSALVLLLGKGKNIAVPFGPFLATGAILSLAFPQISIFP